MEWYSKVLAVVLTAAVLCACSKPKDIPDQTASADFKTADELISEAEERQKEEIYSRNADVYGGAAGEYIFATEGVDKAYLPRLELSMEGTAVFHANLLSGMGDMKGTYVVDGQSVKITVQEITFTGFAGDNVTDMVFDFVSDDTLQLVYTTPDTAVGLTNPGDQFVRKAQ